MKIAFFEPARLVASGFDRARGLAFANLLRDLPHVRNDRVFRFRCSLEGREERDCELRLSEYVANLGVQVCYAAMSDRLFVLGLPEPERAKAYRLDAIAEKLEILSATNWYERVFTCEVSGLPPRMLAQLLVPDLRLDADVHRVGRPKPDLTGPVDPFLPSHEEELLTRLLDAGLRMPEPRVVDDPVLVERYRRLGDRVKRLANVVVASARRWMSTPARGNFKEIMDAAVIQPQVVERGGEEIIVISRRLLDAYANPKSAAEIVESFRRNPVHAPPLDMQRSEAPDVDDFELPALH